MDETFREKRPVPYEKYCDWIEADYRRSEEGKKWLKTEDGRRWSQSSSQSSTAQSSKQSNTAQRAKRDPDHPPVNTSRNSESRRGQRDKDGFYTDDYY